MSGLKVLVPLDGSRLAEHALAFLPALSQFGDLNVRLVTAVDFEADLIDAVTGEEQAREANLLSTYLREIADDLEKHLGATVQCETAPGQASAAILAQAEDFAPDLLVISTHGRSGLARLRRGAIADKVIRDARCPVLAVGPKAMEKGQWLEAGTEPPFKQILVPLDGSDLSEQALPTATGYAGQFGSRLHLLRVMPYVPLASGFVQEPATLSQRVLETGQAYLKDLSGKQALPQTTATHVSVGAPTIEIEAYVQANDIDLVVMTSHGRGGLARAALGSVTDRVIGLGPPVVIVRSA